MLMMLVTSLSCSKTPTAPEPPPPPPPPPPPVADAPKLTCAEGLSRSTVNSTGMTVTFEMPVVTGGEGSVSVSCSPESGTTFPIGLTPVTCTATDTLSRTATCSFSVNVSRLPTLQRTKFLAYGDSITAGEVTSPIGSTATGLITKQVLVPTAAWPYLLGRTLQARYASQASQIVVSNYGLSGERSVASRERFVQALNSQRPEVVMIMHGHNDIPGGADGAASSGAAEIERMVQDARLRGMRVYLATICPPRPEGNRAISQFLVDDWNSRMRIIAARQGVTLVDIYAALLTDVRRYIGVDGLHPTEAGYAKIADTFFQVIQSDLEVR